MPELGAFLPATNVKSAIEQQRNFARKADSITHEKALPENSGFLLNDTDVLIFITYIGLWGLSATQIKKEKTWHNQ